MSEHDYRNFCLQGLELAVLQALNIYVYIYCLQYIHLTKKWTVDKTQTSLARFLTFE